jgi:hypothetical protein
VLWREIYQALYDNPLDKLHLTTEEPVSFDWQHRVTDLARVHQLCKDAYTAPSVRVGSFPVAGADARHDRC